MYKLLMLGTMLGVGFGIFKMIKNKKSEHINSQPSQQPA